MLPVQVAQQLGWPEDSTAASSQLPHRTAPRVAALRASAEDWSGRSSESAQGQGRGLALRPRVAAVAVAMSSQLGPTLAGSVLVQM